jgi:uncharacterized membrane protein YqgA involved in biofilm formation
MTIDIDIGQRLGTIIRSYLDRFVHPILAAIVTIGCVLCVISFLIAGIGVVLRSGGAFEIAVQLLFVSGLIGVPGILLVTACILWLVGLRSIQVVHSRRR